MALSIAGLVHAVAQPAVNTTLAMATSSRWKASVFGLKQAAVPGAYMLAGLSASISPWRDNWRLAFLCGVGVALVGTWFIQFIDEIGRLENHEGRPGSAKMRRVSLVWLVAGGGFGAAAGNCLGSFLLTSLVVLGVTQATAGLVVGLSSAIGVGTRIVAAWTTDLRRGDGLGTVVSMLGVGTIGFVLLATQQEFIFLVLGSLLAFAIGFGWPGVYQFLVVNSNRGVAGKINGFCPIGYPDWRRVRTPHFWISSRAFLAANSMECRRSLVCDSRRSLRPCCHQREREPDARLITHWWGYPEALR